MIKKELLREHTVSFTNQRKLVTLEIVYFGSGAALLNGIVRGMKGTIQLNP